MGIPDKHIIGPVSASPLQMIMEFSHLPDNQPWPYPPPTGPAAKIDGSGGYVSAVWADWTVLPAINVVNDALYTGDLGPGKTYLDSLVHYHLYGHMLNASGTPAAGLVIDTTCTQAGHRCLTALIDTSGGSDDGFVQSHANAVVQAWVYYGMQQVARLARWIGRVDVADSLDAKAAAMKVAFNRLMVSDTGAVCDGLCAEINHTSIHSSFYAMAFGLVNDSHRVATFSYIKSRIDSSSVGFPGGSYPIQFLLVALYGAEFDHGHEGMDVLTSTKKHGWLAMMTAHNATTTMECWSPDELPNLSFSHIWSASPSFIIPWYLAGVQPLTPGWNTLEIKPQPGSLTSFTLSMTTVKGPVHTNVTQVFGAGGELAHFRLEASIPGNVAAKLHVPRPPSQYDPPLPPPL